MENEREFIEAIMTRTYKNARLLGRVAWNQERVAADESNDHETRVKAANIAADARKREEEIIGKWRLY